MREDPRRDIAGGRGRASASEPRLRTLLFGLHRTIGPSDRGNPDLLDHDFQGLLASSRCTLSSAPAAAAATSSGSPATHAVATARATRRSPTTH